MTSSPKKIALGMNIKFRQPRGFSLVEIAVVLLIITVLATAVGIPATAALRARNASETQMTQ